MWMNAKNFLDICVLYMPYVKIQLVHFCAIASLAFCYRLMAEIVMVYYKMFILTGANFGVLYFCYLFSSTGDSKGVGNSCCGGGGVIIFWDFLRRYPIDYDVIQRTLISTFFMYVFN